MASTDMRRGNAAGNPGSGAFTGATGVPLTDRLQILPPRDDGEIVLDPTCGKVVSGEISHNSRANAQCRRRAAVLG